MVAVGAARWQGDLTKMSGGRNRTLRNTVVQGEWEASSSAQHELEQISPSQASESRVASLAAVRRSTSATRSTSAASKRRRPPVQGLHTLMPTTNPYQPT